MSNLTIGRYDDKSITKDWAGWIEPANAAWIIYLGPDGRPALYYPQREPDGAVIGDGILLAA